MMDGRSKRMKFRFLGTGTSVGVPQIGCTCKTCTSDDPRDTRRRCGAYVRMDDVGLLIDTPPEMREACTAYGIDRVDAIALTHSHMDHVAGFDDVRRFNTINGGTVLPCYASAETEAQMHRIFPYVGVKGGENGLFRPQVSFDNADSFRVGGIAVERFPVEHGFPCCGYILNGAIAYASDCHALPDSVVERIAGVRVLVIDCLRERPHPTHLSKDEALSIIGRISPERAYITHMCHDLTHGEWLEKLRGTCVEPAYDGLELEV